MPAAPFPPCQPRRPARRRRHRTRTPATRHEHPTTFQRSDLRQEDSTRQRAPPGRPAAPRTRSGTLDRLSRYRSLRRVADIRVRRGCRVTRVPLRGGGAERGRRWARRRPARIQPTPPRRPGSASAQAADYHETTSRRTAPRTAADHSEPPGRPFPCQVSARCRLAPQPRIHPGERPGQGRSGGRRGRGDRRAGLLRSGACLLLRGGLAGAFGAGGEAGGMRQDGLPARGRARSRAGGPTRRGRGPGRRAGAVRRPAGSPGRAGCQRPCTGPRRRSGARCASAAGSPAGGALRAASWRPASRSAMAWRASWQAVSRTGLRQAASTPSDVIRTACAAG